MNKLGIVITGLGVGGAENHLLKTLPKLKTPLFVISLTNLNDVGKELEKKGIKIYYLGLKKCPGSLFLTILKFRKIIKKEKPTILNSYLIHSNIFTRLFGRLSGVKKIVCSVRNKHINQGFLNKIDQLTSSKVDLYLPNSNSVKKYMIKKIKIPSNKIKVIPNGIDFTKFPKLTKSQKTNKRKSLGFKDSDFIVGTVGSLTQQKNQQILIKAFAKSKRKDSHLLIVGDGPLKDKLKSLSIKRGIKEKVNFLGKRKDAKELMQIMDVFVLPSHYEGMSNALLEAMASEVPILVSNIDENIELVGKENSFKDLKDLIQRLNKIKIKKLVYKNMKNYDIDKIAKEYEKIIKGISK